MYGLPSLAFGRPRATIAIVEIVNSIGSLQHCVNIGKSLCIFTVSGNHVLYNL